jgi:hypothetical protein
MVPFSRDNYTFDIWHSKIWATEEFSDNYAYVGKFLHQGEPLDNHILEELDSAKNASEQFSLSVQQIIEHCFLKINNFQVQLIHNYGGFDTLGLVFIENDHVLFNIVLERHVSKADLKRQITLVTDQLSDAIKTIHQLEQDMKQNVSN